MRNFSILSRLSYMLSSFSNFPNRMGSSMTSGQGKLKSTSMLATVRILTLILGSLMLPSLLSVTLDDIAIGLDTGQYTSVDLVTAYIARIKEVNDELHAVIE